MFGVVNPESRSWKKKLKYGIEHARPGNELIKPVILKSEYMPI